MGCFVLGLFAAAATGDVVGPRVLAGVGTGFCGALATYRTFSYETLRLTEERAVFEAIANVAASVVAGLGAVVVGRAVGSALG